MKGLLILLTIIWFALCSLWWYPCKVHGVCMGKKVEQKVPKAEEQPAIKPQPKPKPAALNFNNITLKDAGIDAKGNIRFAMNKFQPQLMPNVKTAYTDLAKYLKGNPDKQVTLTGLYTGAEQYTGLLKNLGVNRAEAAKNELVTLGAARKQILTAGEKVASLKSEKNVMIGAMKYELGNLVAGKADEAKLAAAKKAVFGVSKNVYFETGSDNIIVDDNLRKFIADLQYYSGEVGEAKVSVTGHTDNTGNAQKNMQLSVKRANQIQRLLAQSGISNSQMKANGKGITAPIADNNTAEGRAKNRRVEIRVD